MCLKETFEIRFFFPLSWHTLIAEMPPSTPCGNNLAENPPGLHVIVSHHSTPPQLSSATLIHKARRYLSERVDQDFSGCADLGPIRHLRLNRMPAEIRDLSPLCSTCGYKEANPCGHCTLSFQFFFFFYRSSSSPKMRSRCCSG